MKILLIIIICVALLILGGSVYLLFYALRRPKSEIVLPMNEEIKVLVEMMQEETENAQKWADSTPHEKRTLTSNDNLKLVADFYPNNSHNYAVLIHGYTSNRFAEQKFARHFFSWGFNCLLPDNRSHGESEGKWIGMGALDSVDILKWINTLVEKDPKAKIVVMGESMGAATTMMLSGLNVPDNVKCYVEDCGYSSVWDEFKYQCGHMMHIPSFPLLNVANLLSRLVCHYDFKKASSLDALSRCKKPVLFIHGKEDKFVPYFMMDKNINAFKGEKEILRVDKAFHAMSYAIHPEKYVSVVKNFVGRYI